MVVRPSDWFLVELAVDPTPGDAFGIRSLASKYSDIATIAGDASSGVRNARSSGATSAWVGDAGDIFRDKSERMPGELAKANDSYEMVADALRAWASSVDDTQAQADRGLQQAREAHADLASAQSALSSAEWSWTTAHAQQLTYQKLVKQYTSVPPPSGVTMPTDYQLRSTDRSAQHAQSSIAAANSRIADANARLAAARALVASAKERRDDAERTAVHLISQAGQHAVKPSSVWEAIQDSAAWQAIVVVATVVLTIITIVAIFVGGPLVWALIIAATVLLMVDALMSIAQGKDAWGELILLGIGLIPGGRLLGLAAKGVEAFARTGEAGLRIANGIHSVTGVVLRVADAITGRVTTVLASLERSAMAAFPRVTTLVEHSAIAAHSALDSFFNPSWLSHFHPGGSVDVVTAAAHHGGQAGGLGDDVSVMGTPGAGAAHDGVASAHGVDAPPHDAPGADAPHDAPGTDAPHAESAASGGSGDSGQTAAAQGPWDPDRGAQHGGANLEGDADPQRWELVPAGEDIGPRPSDTIAAAHQSQTDNKYLEDDLTIGHLEPGQRVEMGYNYPLPDHLNPEGGGVHGVEAGGPSAYSGWVFPEGTAERYGQSKDALFQAGQVHKDIDLGYRGEVIRFEASTRVEVAQGSALANVYEPIPENAAPGFEQVFLGHGGAPQFQIPELVKAAHYGEMSPIDAHGNPLPFRIYRDLQEGGYAIQIFTTREADLIHLH